jgi:hypothetical protein
VEKQVENGHRAMLINGDLAPLCWGCPEFCSAKKFKAKGAEKSPKLQYKIMSRFEYLDLVVLVCA